MQRQYFTVDEINRLIPRLEELVFEIFEVHRQLVQLERALEDVVAPRANGNGFRLTQESQARTMQEEVERVIARFQQLVQEVADLGGELKDPEMGLVDFRALRQGREVYLCWRMGEPECTWWHDLETGFAGRQPVE
ncbi:MAG: DUF2203 domain-containing protein [Chloroflexi bacterium]|nr:DUF2203 domain-containing protein [Chloroflexota bacterium]